MKSLNNENLSQLGSQVAIPHYDRSDLRAGIVHFGVGGFHRAHQARYLDELMGQGLAHDWAICGVGVMPSDRRMAEVMAAQNCLYTHVVKHADGKYDARVVGSIVDYLYAPDDPMAVIRKMSSPEIRIVSLTITEGGYNFHQVTGEFNFEQEDVRADLAAGAIPRTVFGLVTAALAERRKSNLPPFTLMSCDNIQGNGKVAKKMFTSFARRKDPELAAWMEEHVAFPNCMVDRITPVTSDKDRQEVRERFGVDDAWPVVCEPYTQWVVQDSFVQGRPPYEKVGVQFVNDVEPYELIKLRLLNATHQALCYFGYLAGYRYAHEVCKDPLFVKFLLDYMDKEATPTLDPLPDVDLYTYKRTFIERCANPEIHDTLARLCAESSDRIPKFLLPVVRRELELDGPIERSAAVVASWARYAEGTDEAGQPIAIVDRLAEGLKQAAARNHDDPLAFVRDQNIFGGLSGNARFATAYTNALQRLHQHGARATVEWLCQLQP